ESTRSQSGEALVAVSSKLANQVQTQNLVRYLDTRSALDRTNQVREFRASASRAEMLADTQGNALAPRRQVRRSKSLQARAKEERWTRCSNGSWSSSSWACSSSSSRSGWRRTKRAQAPSRRSRSDPC